jgi:hypothetical protein
MTSLPDELAADVAVPVERSDPARLEAEEFLAARFDAGLAWLHFPEGCGGRAPDPTQ